MKKTLVAVTAVAAMLALGACASDSGKGDTAAKAPAKPKTMTAEEMKKAFGRGSIACSVTLADGTKAKDFYYRDITATSGNMDRNVGDKITPGKWKMAGPAFYVNTGKGKKALGTWMNLAKTGKKSYDAYNAAGKKIMSMKC
ncbi:MAG: hypothetical protein OXT06_04000 [Rhodospirillaceae bacterium]|nr:hypothetical protein [Rhodospirillaceae bacterium]MDD9916892.1 hypothetical protein [Rhodospirillaceae bacterium]